MAKHPQPREGIAGSDRSGNDLLSLDERALAHRDALIAMAGHLSTATLVGNPAPIVQRMSERLRSPQVGDLVVESSKAIRTSNVDDRVRGFGFLVAKRTEWWQTDEEWLAEKAEDDGLTDEDRMTDVAWYVQYGPDPGDVCRWVNCEFMVVPIDPHEFATPIGQPATDRRGGVVITRDSLLAHLADSGFELKGGS